MKENNKPSGIVCCDENQETIQYTLEKSGKKVTFAVNPIYQKTGETICEIMLKLMQSETKNLDFMRIF